MPKQPKYEVQVNYKPLNATSLAFAAAYARDQNLVQAAVAAGFPTRMAISAGMALLVDVRVSSAIVSYMRDPEEAWQFAEDWGLHINDDDEDGPSLFDRISAAREKLALESRNGLPPPAELIITRPKPSRRQRRAAQPQRSA